MGAERAKKYRTKTLRMDRSPIRPRSERGPESKRKANLAAKRKNVANGPKVRFGREKTNTDCKALRGFIPHPMAKNPGKRAVRSAHRAFSRNRR